MRARKITTPLLVSATLIIGLTLPISSATAFAVKEIPAGWVHTYAAPELVSSINPTPVTNTAHLNSASTINITFQNIPAQEQVAIQAAINIWNIY
jgi:hypothetical protein